MKPIYVKNLDSVAHTYAGQTIDAGQMHLVTDDTERLRFSHDLLLNQHLWASTPLVSIGDSISFWSGALGDQYLKFEDPENTDGRKIVHATPRKRGLFTCFIGAADSQVDPSRIAGADGTPLVYHHQIGDTSPAKIYFDLNTIANETYAHAGHMMWKDALLDFVSLETVPKLSTYTISSDTFFNLYGGYLVIPAAGNGNINMTSMNLVEVPTNEFGTRSGAGYWDASYDTVNKVFTNIVPNVYGQGRFNMFTMEIVFDRFINRMPMLGDGFLSLDTYDASQLGHGMRLRLTFETSAAGDHEWYWCAGLKPYRKKTS